MSFENRTDAPHHRPSDHRTSACAATATTRRTRISDETREVAIASADLAADLLPAGWTAHATPTAGGVYLLVLTPPEGTAQAQLIAPHAGHGWAIGITDPTGGTDGTDTVLRTIDGDIAYQPTLATAIRAAIDALDSAATSTPGPDRHVGGAVHYLDSGCLVGLTDAHRPHLVHVRAVEHGGHPHAMLPTLRRIFTTAGHDSADIGARLLAHDWDRLDPTTGGRGVTGRRAIAGVGIAYAATGPDGRAPEPEPADVVPLAHLSELDTAWLYLLDPGAGTVTVHTGDGHPVSRHPLTH
ncbi:hypothetical protein OHA72_10505 [Dactylosporangium sp. NBC_01737]|uniref:hypothetical protein n=1 Tax=Dactylosporangium sp. NBC_01737 TaxID=2975959 RepID=UPI002E0ED9D8|nr:hypothetical protein OHA72_10505 [Dactylosporangium sp. NBC_01737]